MRRTCELGDCEQEVRGRRRYCSDDHAAEGKRLNAEHDRSVNGDAYNANRRAKRARGQPEYSGGPVVDYSSSGSRPPVFPGVLHPPAAPRRPAEVVDYSGRNYSTAPGQPSQEVHPRKAMHGQRDYQRAASLRAADRPRDEAMSEAAWKILAEEGEEALVEFLADREQDEPHRHDYYFVPTWGSSRYKDPREAEMSDNVFYR